MKAALASAAAMFGGAAWLVDSRPMTVLCAVGATACAVGVGFLVARSYRRP